MASLTEGTAKLICSFAGVAIPEEALYRSKLGIMDCIGVALAGSQEPVGRIMREYARSAGGRPEASVWGTVDKISAAEAALVNGAMAHALDYDDVNRPTLGHPSAVLAPALFAMVEKLQLPGRKLLEAYVVGLEVMGRLGRIFGPEAYDKSWHATPIFGVLGACAGGCYLLRLDPEQTASAIGIAASEAAGLKKNFGSMMKPLHAGSAARKGIWAALLAQMGITADAQALDGTYGYMEMFHGKPYDPDAMNDLDRPPEILASGLGFKQYPCCGGLASVVDNMLTLRQQHGLTPQLVQAIECRVHPNRITYLDRPQAREPLEAKFSIQYCAATALLHGKLGLEHFVGENLTRPETHAIMSRVRITPTEEFGGFGSEVKVRTADGREFSGTQPESKGSPTFPLSEAEILAKFVDCAMTTLSSARANQAGAALMSIQSALNLGAIARLLAAE